MFEIQDLNHVNIVVEDLEVCRHFYCHILGMEEVQRNSDFTFPGGWFRANSAEIHVIRSDIATHPPGDESYQIADTTEKELSLSRHFSLVIDDTEQLVKHLEKHQVSIAYGPVERRGGLIQTYCYDPDGHLIEFSQLGE